MSALAVAVIAATGTALAAFLGFLGVRYTGRTTSLERATQAWELLYKGQEERMAALAARLDRVEQANDALADENRLLREVVAGVVVRVKRDPPETATGVLSYVLGHLPSFGQEGSG